MPPYNYIKEIATVWTQFVSEMPFNTWHCAHDVNDDNDDNDDGFHDYNVCRIANGKNV